MRLEKKGQAILVVMMVAAVILTVGLAATTQTVSDLSTVVHEQEYQRAFNAAEAGVEELLSQGGLPSLAPLESLKDCRKNESIPCASDTLPDGGVLDYQFLLEERGETESGYELLSPLLNGDVFQLNLDPYEANEINIYWSSTIADEQTAIEAVFYYNNGEIYRLAIKSEGSDNKCSGLGADFVTASANHDSNNIKYNWKYNVSGGNIFTNDLKFLRVRPFCTQETWIAFRPQNAEKSFPVQSYLAHVESQSADDTAAVEVEQSAQKYLPSVFDYVLYSGQNIDL